MRAQTGLLLILFVLFASPAFSEIYSFIDSKGRLAYTSDPSILPEGHEHKTAPLVGNEQLESADQLPVGSQDILIEHLYQQAELAKLEMDRKLEKLSETPVAEHDQAVHDILSLKFEILELNEEIIGLTATNQDESRVRLQQLNVWAENVDILLEEFGQADGLQVRNSKQDVPSLNVGTATFSNSSFSSRKKVNTVTGNSSPSSVSSWQ